MSEKVNNSPQKHRGPMGAVEKPKNFKIYSGKYIKKPHKEIDDQ